MKRLPTGPPRGASGYTLVVLVIAITVLNVLVAAALPLWSTAIKREKEEELIFRGLQYAEAIRVFQHRNNRLPRRLEELMEVEPRCIRKLWKDPMTKDGKWDLIFQTGGPGNRVPGRNPGAQTNLNPPTDTNGRGEDGRGEVVTVGPIMGVRSKSHDESIHVFLNETHYDQWAFTVNLLQAPAVVPGQPGGAVPRVARSEWIGRPFRAGVAVPGLRQGGLPGGPAATGNNGGPGRPSANPLTGEGVIRPRPRRPE